ncbi:PREDICTED: D-tyrosyl-tRNA(Tyr) deacylase 1 [Mandrillus leucophaeus]|uniref:D-tyrosyl-tRNA(Tyr) deacylase 1 n=1 Tax=Mandrillus leucophaeus TaxID=9568 RepID=UPI0005F56B51|nr:PREDICTED: D-tyrosyl-tRNA(Tyr) deacylase 1 [Mandrillus leucophaeus]
MAEPRSIPVARSSGSVDEPRDEMHRCEELLLGLSSDSCVHARDWNPGWMKGAPRPERPSPSVAELCAEGSGSKEFKMKTSLFFTHFLWTKPPDPWSSLEHSSLVGGEQISAIGRGICVLLGISLEDTQKELEHMVRKILNLRVFEDESGKHWSKSVMDKQYEILCVSQFTLQCVLKGNKPDFHLAMPTEQAEGFYNSFLEQLRKTYRPELIKDGKFGAYMQVHIQNDGPVTIELESPAPGTATSDPKQLSKLEKQQQRKEKTRAKGPSESSKERNTPRKEDRSASSGAEGDVSSEREP